jgi:MinD-like ATPase involved in chromosome partitioning or flagellar assembly
VAHIISVHSFRGGTGKSNTTANLSALIAATGKRVGVIDTDIQSPGIHVVFGRNPASFKYALNDYLWGRCSVEEAACDVTEASIGKVIPGSDRPRIFLIPSSIQTGEIARILREGYDVSLLNDGFHALIERLKLDYLLVDTHPGVNEETLLSIALSDLFVLILRPDNQDFQGTSVTVELARRLDVKKALVIINKVPASMDRDFLREQVQSGYDVEVAGILPLCSEMAELASSGLFVNRHPQHELSASLRRIAERILLECP